MMQINHYNAKQTWTNKLNYCHNQSGYVYVGANSL